MQAKDSEGQEGGRRSTRSVRISTVLFAYSDGSTSRRKKAPKRTLAVISNDRETDKHQKMEEPREKLAQKSNNITETPMRSQVVAIMPNAKNSKREHDPPKN